jgi:RNA polymerase sigma factor (sigma-70 family)
MANAQAAPIIRWIRHLAAVDRPDSQLLHRFASHRDEDAFAALVRRHGPMVLAVCRRVLHDAHAAEDCFQATFLTLARKAGALREPESLGPWLYGVANRTALKARERAARRRVRERRAAVPEAVELRDGVAWRELRPVLDAAVQRLPDKYRVPFVLHCLQSLTVAEVARRLGCPPGTVAARLARAREQLRRRLSRHGLSLSAGALVAALAENAAAARVPAPLLAATARAATLAAGQTVAAAIRSAAAALTHGGGKAMLTAKVKVASVVLLGLGLVIGGGSALSGRCDVALADESSAAVSGQDQSGRELLDRISVQQAEKDWQIAEFYRRTGHLGSARFYYELVRRRYPGTLYADRAGERLRELGQKATSAAGDPLATVNGVPIFRSEVYAAAYLADPELYTLGLFARTLRIAGTWKDTLGQLVEHEVVMQSVRGRFAQPRPQALQKLEEAASAEFKRKWEKAARRLTGREDHDALETTLRSQGTSLAAVRRQWQRAFIAQEYLRSRLATSGSQFGRRTAEATRIVDDLKRRAVIEYGGAD